MRRLVLALGAAVAVGALASGAAQSAPKGTVLCVRNAPHCYPTIQAALDAAHDGDTIQIGFGTFAGGISVTKSVSLVGVAPGATLIRGGGPVVTIGTATSAPTVTIADVTVTGGLTTTNPQNPKCGPDVPTCGPGYAGATALGGGIEAFPGTTVTIVHSVVADNKAAPATAVDSVKAVCPTGPCPASFGDAAGIDNWGTMTLIGTIVSDNHASAVQSNGGGIVDEANASLTLQGSRVVGNSASAIAPFGRFASGGGVFVDSGGTLRVENSAIDGNSATLASTIPHPYPQQGGGTDQTNAVGGGLYLTDGAQATIRNSALDGNAVTVQNSAGEPFGADAAICACGNVPLTIENVQIVGNRLVVNVLSGADSGPSGPTALEADGNATIRNSRISGNTSNVTSPTGDAGALGAVAFFFGGSVAPAIWNSTISNNASTASAPTGAATIQGAGITNNGPLTLVNDQVSGNRGTAVGHTGFAQGGGLWNGVLFGGPDSPLTLQSTAVTGNTLTASSGLTIQGAGIFTPGFPLTLTNSFVGHNSPDQCFGC